MTHKAQIAKAIRRDLKTLNIDARVKSFESCGYDCIRVSTVDIDTEWTTEEAKKVGEIAKFYDLSGTMGMDILGVNVLAQEFQVN